MVQIKNRSEVLNDVIKKGKKHPKNWNAVFSKDTKLMSNDYYLMNPNIGIFMLKEYQKNPYEIKGIGGKVARRIDDEIINKVSQKSGDFGIIQGDFNKIYKNINRGVKPKEIFDSAIKGKKDYGLKIPIKGKASNSDEAYKYINNELSEGKKKIDEKFEKIASDEGLYSSYD